MKYMLSLYFIFCATRRRYTIKIMQATISHSHYNVFNPPDWLSFLIKCFQCLKYFSCILSFVSHRIHTKMLSSFLESTPQFLHLGSRKQVDLWFLFGWNLERCQGKYWCMQIKLILLKVMPEFHWLLIKF